MAVIYIDVLFVVNLIVNYLLLRVSCIFSGINFNRYRVLVAAIVGACYSVLVFFPDFTVVCSMIFKLLVSMLLVAIAFPFYSIRSFLKTLLIFYAVSFGFGGCVLGTFYFTNIGARFGAVYSNGVLYFNLPWSVLAISWCVFYISVKFFGVITKKTLHKKSLQKKLLLYFKDKTVEVTALLDTGNSLIDPISLSPVIIVEYSILKNLFSKEIQQTLDRLGFDSIDWIMREANAKGLSTRLIPFSSIGKENGILLGFIPDRIEIYDECGVKQVDKCVIGLCESSLSKDKSYSALLNPYV